MVSVFSVIATAVFGSRLASVLPVTAVAAVIVVVVDDDDECGTVVQAVPLLLSPSLVTIESEAAAAAAADEEEEDIALILSFLIFHLSSSAEISNEGRPNTVNRSSSSLSSVIPSTDVEMDLIICSLGRGTELRRA